MSDPMKTLTGLIKTDKFYCMFLKNRILHLNLFLASALLLITGTSCDRSVIFEENQKVPDQSWKAEDTLFFSFQVADTLTPIDFYFNLRNTTDYPFQNLYLFVTSYYPGNLYSRDTIDCLLAEADGKWIGKGSGKLLDARFLFRKGVQFRRAGNYTIAINQAMRTPLLKGISDVGIRIEKSQGSE